MTDDTPETLAALRSAGWAPGEYVFRCRDCGADARSTPMPCGAKRSTRCRPCAEKVVAARIADADALVEESIRRIVAEQAAREDAAETFPPIWGDEDDLSVFPELDDACREAVERVARTLDTVMGDDALDEVRATLRALAAERTALRQKVAVLIADGLVMQSERDAALSRAEAAERERDALLVVARASGELPHRAGTERESMDTVILRLSAYRKLRAAIDALPAGILDQSR